MKNLANKIADLIVANKGWKHRYTDAYDLANLKILELPELKAIQMQAEVKTDACGRWQKKKPKAPCYFVHRYNKKDNHPSMFQAYIDTEVLCVANIQDDAFVETMEGFADGEFYIIEYLSKHSF
jgi:hypothetical protein